MHSAVIALAHGRGTIHIKRTLVESGGWLAPVGDQYDVQHVCNGELVRQEIIDRRAGESTKDAKARCVAAVGMLMHWPSMLAEFAQDAKSQRAVAGELPGPEATLPAGGIILPPGMEWTR